MTYDAHDTDDAVKLRLVTLDELGQNVLIRDALDSVRSRYADLRDDLLRKAVVHQLIDRQVTDVLNHASRRLAAEAPPSAVAARRLSLVVGPSPEMAQLKRELERFLYERVYRHPRLAAVRTQAQERLKRMFEGYLARPELLPPRYQQRAAAVGLPRAIGDYLAGMTDRFCDQQFRQHFDTPG
jgi:dGTPase